MCSRVNFSVGERMCRRDKFCAVGLKAVERSYTVLNKN